MKATMGVTAQKDEGGRTMAVDRSWDLVLKNKGIAYKLAARCAKASTVEFADLAQEAMIALHHAAVTFEPDRGFAFSTYAWIVIQRHLATVARKCFCRKRRLPTVGAERLLAIAASDPGGRRLNFAALDESEYRLLDRLYGLSGPATSLCEIAAERGCHRHTVRRARNQALTKLREQLELDEEPIVGAA
jgi:DNA-directed RNA polymerase sigma subunit (sigma70/sigma32)